MILKKFKSQKTVNVNLGQYKIDWEHKVSKPQKTFKDFVFPFWKGHVVLEELLIPGSKNRIDIVNITRGYCIEISPESTHAKFNKFMHGSRAGYLKRIKTDLDKETWCLDNGFEFIEVTDVDLLEENLTQEYYEKKFKIVL